MGHAGETFLLWCFRVCDVSLRVPKVRLNAEEGPVDARRFEACCPVAAMREDAD